MGKVERLLAGAIQRLTECLLTDDTARSMATFIVDSMSTPARVYHTMDHVLEMIHDIEIDTGMEHPILILAALFHDIVYLTVDLYLSKEQKYTLANIVHDPNESQSLAL